ncbi:NADH-quinone oxidoreductase subunit NuoE [Myxococcota bacterium]|nr:NADH-quinone oxidoreductase subunit NuoE [Myxococcota bacterium]MBU1432888.1 NADH-quinone oxidoreductase subunit NuoE [Myxococcota bacterium]MBU1900104.1 NADH-quinone oxidoreductase subunit NuoE [Myxococcota bacterium]
MSDRFAEALWTRKGERGDLIPLLQAAQEAQGYVSEQAMEAIAEITGIPLAEIYGVVTFYKGFRLTPRGHYVARVCTGTACHVNGASELESTLINEVGVERGQTDAEGIFTLEAVNCVGCCSLAPVIMVNDETHGPLTPRSLTQLLKRLRREAKLAMAPKEAP